MTDQLTTIILSTEATDSSNSVYCYNHYYIRNDVFVLTDIDLIDWYNSWMERVDMYLHTCNTMFWVIARHFL